MNTLAKSYGDFINESKITYKRKYTESFPAKNSYSNGKIKAKIIETIADGKITTEEFNKILKELNANSRWPSRNSYLFKINEDGITLSSIGQRIFNKTKNKTQQASAYIKTFEQFVNELEENVSLNPGMTVIGMGPVKFPGNAGTTTAFHGQNIGSGETSMFLFDPAEDKDDEEDEIKRIKKIKQLLKKKKIN